MKFTRKLIACFIVLAANSACAQTPLTPPAQGSTAKPNPVVITTTAQAPMPTTIATAPSAATVTARQISATNPDVEAFFDDAVQLINQYRSGRKLSLLARDGRLDKIAAAHSNYMAAKDDLSHDGFNERFNQANMQSCAENVAWNQITASELVNDWIASPVHDKNLLKPNVTRVGLGRAKGYTTYFVCQP
ncbi:MAG: CAP domain-containing protein [Burkholderiales bacterium]